MRFGSLAAYLLIGGLGVAGFIALALANLAILVYDRYLSREPITV